MTTKKIDLIPTETHNFYRVTANGRKVQATASFRQYAPNAWLANCRRGNTFATVQATDLETLCKKIAAVYK